MHRRRFIQATAASLFMPSILACAQAVRMTEALAGPDCFFFDGRFETARRLAAEWRGPGAPVSVQSDITDIWRGGLDRACQVHGLTLNGVTTESFYFCLRIMMGESVIVDGHITRIDRDLHRWTIRSAGQIDKGVSA